MNVAFGSRYLSERLASPRMQAIAQRRVAEVLAIVLALVSITTLVALVSYDARDPSLNTATTAPPANLAGASGAILADLLIQGFGLAALLLPLALLGWAWRIGSHRGLGSLALRGIALLCALPAAAAAFSALPILMHTQFLRWPGPAGLGGAVGQTLARIALSAGHDMIGVAGAPLAWALCAMLALVLSPLSLALSAGEWRAAGRGARRAARFSTRPVMQYGDRETGTVAGRSRAAARRQARFTVPSWLRRRTAMPTDGFVPDADLPDRTSSGPSPFASRARDSVLDRAADTATSATAVAGRRAAVAEPSVRPDAREERSRARREPSLSPVPSRGPGAGPTPQNGGGYMLPPGAGDEHDEVPILPLRSAAARAAARRASETATPVQATGSRTADRENPSHADMQPAPVREGALMSIRKLLGGRVEPAAGASAQPLPAAAASRPVPPRRAPEPDGEGWTLPPLSLLKAAPPRSATGPSPESQQANARLLETVLSDYGVQGAIGEIHAGPVVTLYELEPAPGIRSARVIGLADDIARSLSVTAVRIATVPGRNVIGIEVPNARRETVYFSELLDLEAWHANPSRLCLALGKDISGAPIYADLARMPHLLIAGTTGSGKSVGINSMILSLLYRLSPDECRLIMIDPKMLELSIYDGIPHLMAPVVTEPAKAVTALKWTVREMERRYRGMSQLGVRNINGYNDRVAVARERGEVLMRRVQTGFDPETGKPIFEEQPLNLENLPYIVVVIDEMADLMMVAGKEIESTVQRLAQMARAAGIHVIMATQRPSVDVITGTIKANFPTRISFQVISKFDSRTILGEQGAEQLLGQGDMLYMQGGGRITRVHGPFVGDAEVEDVVRHLRQQGEPTYLDDVTSPFEEDASGSSGGGGSGGGSGNGLNGGNFDGEAGLFDQAVALVAREGKASTSFIQRHLSIGYNRAAKLIEQMEKEGMVGPANHVGKREVLLRRETAED
ncbi:DNA translocase FtsK [Lichenicoccus roseus]|uniref:DNA translocase FtsK n=1 Tax=Lichenicoccus roseus TaxID=2683649 RepID=A0A5R9J1G9_9PROT|nr:DNA translocase FtsK [Lichenicoccus roseus]TLU71505.1 DNA translocase FtsK [Lichenicoccus roseus]